VLRTALVSFAVIFLPIAIWFACKLHWGSALALLIVSAAFLKLGLSHDEDSWMSAIDELDFPHKPPGRRGK
jgi:hypothetical protein